ncbi:MAG: type IV secretory system conjugative DNA transfer family protein, partial [Planctomycetota bacterium]
METGLALTHDNVMRRLGSHELTRRWLSEHPEGWDDQAFERLRSELAVAGFGSLDADALETRLVELKAIAQSKPRRVSPRRAPTHDQVYQVDRLATAEWADPEDFAARNRFRIGDLWLGRSPLHGEPLGYSDDRHALIASGTRGGKGASLILPNLMLWPGSMVVMDPKGENASVAAARRGDGKDYVMGMKQKVAVLDPMRIAEVEDKYRKRYNPLDMIEVGSDDMEDQAAVLAEAIIIRTGNETDDYWKDEAEAALQAIILHVKTTPYLKDEDRNLVTVRRYILRGDVERVERLKEHYAKQADEQGTEAPSPPSPHALLFTGMKNNEAG